MTPIIKIKRAPVVEDLFSAAMIEETHRIRDAYIKAATEQEEAIELGLPADQPALDFPGDL